VPGRILREAGRDVNCALPLYVLMLVFRLFLALNVPRGTLYFAL
jgi:hypothetical protein